MDVEVTVKKLRKPAIVYKTASSGNLKLAGRKIVSEASVATCWRQKRFRGDLLRTFHPVIIIIIIIIIIGTTVIRP